MTSNTIAEIRTDVDGFFLVYYNGKQISKKSTMLKATKALAAYEKGRH